MASEAAWIRKLPGKEERIVVTGASGYLGSWLVCNLVQAGFSDVVAADLRPCKDVPAAARVVHLDVTNTASVEAAVVGVKTVVHIAAIVPYNMPRTFGERELRRVNVDGTAAMLDAAARAGCRQFIYASSTGAVFCGADIAAGSETTCPVPSDTRCLNDPYSRSKADAERLVLAAHAGAGGGGMATIALRPNGIFGPGEQHHTPKLLTTAALGGSGALMGAGALTDFSHRDNAVWAVLRAYAALRAPSRGKVGGRAFFVTDGWACHTLEQFAPLLGALGFPAPYRAAVAPLPAPAAVSKAAAAAAETDTSGALALKAGSTRAASSSSPLLAYLAVHPEAWRAAQAARALRVPLRVWEASVRSGEAQAITPEWSHGALHEAASPLDGCPAFLRHALTEEGAGSQQLLLTAEDTFPRALAVPDALVTVGAALLQGAAAAVSLLTLRCLRPEPFLTLADSRKVLRHNYYSSAAAAEELGYAPLTRPAAGIAEVIAFQRAAGASGRIRSPPLAVWVAVVLGLGHTAALAYDWGGLLGAALQAGCAALLSSSGAQSSGAGSALLAAGQGLHPALDCSPGARGGLTALVAYLLKAVFWGAMLCHGLQGLWAFRYARSHRQAAMAWALQTAVCGFGSSQLLVASCGHSARAVPALCISLFLACMPGVAVVDWLCGGTLLGT